jgi:hypothetical protein
MVAGIVDRAVRADRSAVRRARRRALVIGAGEDKARQHLEVIRRTRLIPVMLHVLSLASRQVTGIALQFRDVTS